MDKYWELLIQKAEEFNISITLDQLEQFKKYWTFLDEYNKHTNLVSNTELQTVIYKHFIDSLSIGILKDRINWKSDNNLIDIGIGGGFPGIPIIIVNPEWRLCAVDSTGKKTKFVELLTRELGINDRVEVITSRVEEISDKREKFDLATARAVSQLNILSEYCLPFLKKGGYFIAYKAKGVHEEVTQAEKALSILGGEVETIAPYALPEDNERNLILIKKIKPTPQKYPRRTGIPQKQPL